MKSILLASFFCLALVQIFAFHVLITSATLASYGEFCDSNFHCDRTKFLSCSNGTCKCQISEDMTFDKISKNCLVLANRICQFRVEVGETITNVFLPCISDAFCGKERCECKSNFFEALDSTCQPKRGYGEECTKIDICQDHLKCGEGQTCECGYVEEHQRSENGECIILARQQCNTTEQCTIYSTCLQDQTTATQTCKCDVNYFQTESKLCEKKKDVNEECSDDSECIDYVRYDSAEIKSFLICKNKTCQCDERVAVKEADSLKCGKYVGSECIDGECFTGSSCSPHNRNCTCNHDYFPAPYQLTNSEICLPKKGFGESCLKSYECKPSFQCSKDKKMCDCPVNNVFSQVLQICVVAAGEECGFSINYHAAMKRCVPNARCTPGNRSCDPTATGRSCNYTYTCKCNQYTEQAEEKDDGYCYVPKNGTCDGDTYGTMTALACLPGLACIDGICSCMYENHQEFLKDNNTCLSYIGGPCNSTIPCLDDNAECGMEDGIPQCLCKTGFTQVGRSCQLAYGQRCSKDLMNPRCSSLGPLQCNTVGYCDCIGLQTYNVTELRCKGLVGANCKISEGEKQFCIEGAYCRAFRGLESISGICVCKPGQTTTEDRKCAPESISVSKLYPFPYWEISTQAQTETTILPMY